MYVCVRVRVCARVFVFVCVCVFGGEVAGGRFCCLLGICCAVLARMFHELP